MHYQKLATVLGIIALVVLIALPAGAAEVNRSWEKLVDSAKVGKKVVVRQMNSTQVEGKLLRITDDSIVVDSVFGVYCGV